MNLPTAQGDLEITTDHIEAFALKYPHTDVRAELGKMLLWLERNPKGRWKRPWKAIETWLRKQETENMARGSRRLKSVNVQAWWTDRDATMAKAQELGIVPRAGEDWPELRRRIREKLEAA